MTARYSNQIDPRALLELGPLVKVRVYPSTSAPSNLQPKEGLALIDTGASRSGICKTIAADLHYNPVDFVRIAHANGQSENPNPIFPVKFELPGSRFKPFELLLIGFDLRFQILELLMLLGRDFLLFGQLLYHGSSGFYEIIIPAPPMKTAVVPQLPKTVQPPVLKRAKKKRTKHNKSRGRKKK